MNLLQASEIMRRGEKIPRRQQAGLVIALSVPAILEQLVSTLMSYIDTAMVGSLGYFATASIGVVASTTWLLSGLVSAAAVGFSVQVAQYLGAGRERDSRDVLCQAILFNAAFGAALAVLAVLAGQFLPGGPGRGGGASALCPGVFLHGGRIPALQHGLRILLQHPAMQRERGAAQRFECGHVLAGYAL